MFKPYIAFNLFAQYGDTFLINGVRYLVRKCLAVGDLLESFSQHLVITGYSVHENGA